MQKNEIINSPFILIVLGNYIIISKSPRRAERVFIMANVAQIITENILNKMWTNVNKVDKKKVKN